MLKRWAFSFIVMSWKQDASIILPAWCLNSIVCNVQRDFCSPLIASLCLLKPFQAYIYIFCFVLLCLFQTDPNACWGCWIGFTWDALRCNIRGWLMGFALKAIMILASPGKYINRIILMSLGAVSAIIDCCSYSKGHSFVFLFTPYWIFQVIYCTQSLRAQSSGRCTIFSALSSSSLR